MLGYGGRGGGGGGIGRGGGAHYGPADRTGKGKGKGGRQRGGAKGSGGKSPYLSVQICFDGAARARVIGVGGSVVKQTQKLTGTGIQCARRDAPEGTPTKVSGPSTFSVLHACHLLALQTAAVAPVGGHICTCKLSSGEGDALILRARLQSAAGQPWLFVDGTEEAGHVDAAPFAAIALCTEEPNQLPSSDELAAVLDDLAFSLGTSELPIYSSCSSADPPRSEGQTGMQRKENSIFFVFGIGKEAVRALESVLPALLERFGASSPPAIVPGSIAAAPREPAGVVAASLEPNDDGSSSGEAPEHRQEQPDAE